ncbi:MAG: nitroreductase family protein [Eubacteriales bacterium]|nr:nitroreductase family protein [Eubacteriales bacterium]MDD3882857.1 nitroreductase family protein [Eubacteriales bacterium]MDD4512107.1 nitroreductase family protein [Eubacteriales bacterium]
MNFYELVKTRESCRDYSPRQVEREKLDRALGAALAAPSACNGQPWRYTVVIGEEKRAELLPLIGGTSMNKFARNAPVLIVVEQTATSVSASLGGKHVGEDFRPFDIGMSVMQLCLAASAEGLSTCIIGMLKIAEIKKLYSMKGAPCLAVALGYAAEEGKPPRGKQRKSAEDVLSFIE